MATVQEYSLLSAAEAERPGAFRTIRWTSSRAWAVGVICLATSLSGCSKTLQWQEEIALSPTETVWVKRTVEYERGGSAGNPLDMVWLGRRFALEFNWRGKIYHFDQHGAPTVLRIGATGQPVILAPADAGAWYAQNHYACTTPFYVQFVPDATGKKWTWPASIDPAFYGTETNLLQVLPRPGVGQARYSAQELKAANVAALGRSPQRRRIEPTYTGDHCRGKGK